MDNDDSYKMKYWFGYEQHDVVLIIMFNVIFSYDAAGES